MSRLKTDAIRNVNASVDGITLDTSGNVVVPNELQLADKIVHTGDTNTLIRFPAADVIAFETGGTERLRINSDGRIWVNTQTGSSATELLRVENTGSSSTNSRVSIVSGGAAQAVLLFGDDQSFDQGQIVYSNSDHSMRFHANAGNERLRITSNGRLLLNTADNSGYSNRSAYFTNPNDNWNYISITGSGGAGIVFGDSTGQNVGNYESYMYHDNSDNHFRIRTDQGNKTFTFEAAGNLSIGDGNLKVASGHGIDFSATSGTGQSELLDDYETGSWTPVLKAGGTTITYNTGSSTRFTYTKIGNVCHIFFSLDNRTTSGGNIGGGFEIEGLPFQSGGGRQSNGAGVWYGTGFRLSAWPVVTHIGAGNSKIQLYGKTTAAGNYYTVTLSQVGANSYLFLTLTYETA